MKAYSIEKILTACRGRLFGNPDLLGREIASLVIDSRLAGEGCAYIAIAGERVDGHSFIKDTFKKGAYVCIGEKPYSPEENELYIQVASSQEALGRIAADYMSSLHIPIVGVTGSVGKTGTKEAIAACLSEGFKVSKTKGNHNNEIGLPLTCLEAPEDAEISVLEMGISAEGEMDYLTGIAKPSVAVVTNIGVSHIEILGSKQGIFDEKIKIAKDIGEDGLLIINGDDEFLSNIKNSEINTKAKIIRYGFNSENDIYAENVKINGLDSVDFVIKGLRSAPEGLSVRLPLSGKHNVLNALAAAAAGEYFSLTGDSIKRGLEEVSTVSGRMNIIRTGDITLIDDSYNASPVSMKAAIEALSEAEGRKLCVLGNMYELGKDSRQMHYEVGRFAAQKGVSVLFTCGDLAVDIAKGALGVSLNADLKESARDECIEVMMTDPDMAVVPEFYLFEENDALIKKIREVIRPGDTVLIKASNSMRFSEVVQALM